MIRTVAFLAYWWATTLCAQAAGLIAAEYFVGADPGPGRGVPLSLLAGDFVGGSIGDVPISVANLPAGTYEVGVRVLDDQARWSNPLRRRFSVKSFTVGGGLDPAGGITASSFPSVVERLTRAEYFIGSDPGPGNGTPLPLAAQDGLSSDFSNVAIPVGQLPPGTYSAGVRVKDEAGRWSNPLIRRFTIKSFTVAGGVDPVGATPGSFPQPFQALVQAEYFVGPDPGTGNGVAIPLGEAGLSTDLSTIPIPLTQPPGTYQVGVRARDASGRWSAPLVRRFNLYRTDVIAAQRTGTKLVDLEFDLLYGPRAYTVTVLISNDGGLTWTVPNGSLTGDVGPNVAPGRVKRAVWLASEDWNAGFTEDMRFRVVAYETVQDTPAGFSSLVPGSFSMGSPGTELGRGTDELQRAVIRSKPFYLKNTEVTWNEWNAVRNQGTTYGYTDIAAGRNGLNGDASGNHPVTDVSWMDVVKWCNLRSEIEGRKPVYYSAASLNPATVVRTGIPTVYALWNASGYRLPTESEWEVACRAGSTTAFSNGPITNTTTDPNLDLIGWYAGNSGGNTRPASGKPANARGLYDMHGNVREWCWDGYGTYATGPQWDPIASNNASARVIRGGSFATAASLCRSAARSSAGQNSRATDLGFRVALNYAGLTEASNAVGIPVDSRDPAPGNLLAGYRPAFSGDVTVTVPQPDGKVLVGGEFTAIDGVSRNHLARLNADSAVDSSFNPNVDFTVLSAAVQGDGKILIGGDFGSVGGAPANYLARLFANGALDATFAPSVDLTVHCVAIQGDGKILIGGDFATVNGTARSSLARLNPDGSLDLTFNQSVDSTVRTIAVQTNGQIVIGGPFSSVGGQARGGIARLNADGSVEAAFNPASDGDVYCVALQGDNRVLVGGSFASIGGQTRSNLARLLSTGAVDLTFNPSPDGVVKSIAVQAETTTTHRILVGGDFTTIAGGPRNRLAKLTYAGALEPGFQPDVNGTVNSVALLADGKVTFAGRFSSVGGVTRNRMAWVDNNAVSQTLSALNSSRVRWLRGGSAPETTLVNFEFSTDGGINWLPLGAGSRVSGGWERLNVNLPAQGQLRARARTSGGQGSASSGLVEAVIPFSGLVPVPEISIDLPSGDIPDGGLVSTGTVTLGAVVDFTFTIRNSGYGDLTGLTIAKDGTNAADYTIVQAPSAPVAGPTGSTTFTVRFAPSDTGVRTAAIHIANNDTNENPFDITLSGTGVIAGNLAGAADANINGRVNALAFQSDGKLVVGGDFTSAGGQSRNGVARFLADGSIDPAFNTGSGANGPVHAVALQRDGKVLVAGAFTSVSAQPRNRVARFAPDGLIESTATFNPGTGCNGTVQAMAPQADGKIVVVGDFTAINGATRNRIGRLNSDGTVEALATFNAGTGANGSVTAVAIQPDGRILLGGTFTAINGQNRNSLARLQPDGSLDLTFNPDVNGKVQSIVVQPNGRILLGGLFTSISGQTRTRLARLERNGALEDTATFEATTSADDEVRSMALQADGRIVIAGAFANINSQPRNGVARLFANGTLESTITFNIGTGSNGNVYAAMLRPDGRILIGGQFTSFNGTGPGALAVLANGIPTESLTVLDTRRVTWQRGGSAPEMSVVSLEVSTNGGSTWSDFGIGVGMAGGWDFAGLNLPSTGLVRVRGRAVGGFANGSSSVVEQVQSFLNAATVTTLAATNVTVSGGTLNGTVTPNGKATVYFEYGGTPAYGSTTAVQEYTGGDPISLAVPLNGVGGTISYRVVAVTTGGTYYGANMEFTTPLELPVAVTANPTSVTTAAATLTGAVNPKGRPTTVYFDYGSTLLYGNKTPVQQLPGGFAAAEVTAPLTGLSANALYHYRMVAVNEAGTAYGANITFQATAGGGGPGGSAPSVTTSAATEITTTVATLQGFVNPNGGFTNAFFEYGPTTSYGSVSSALGAGNGTTPASISFLLTGLAPGTSYQYRLVAANGAGTTQGANASFTTAFPPPIVQTGGALSLTTTSAQVSGTVRARNTATQVFFDYGTDGVNFPNSVAATPPTVTDDTEVAVTGDLPNLAQSQIYSYRIRAVSSGGVSTGTASTLQVSILSGFLQQFPPEVPVAQRQGSLTVNLLPTGVMTGWRFVGEKQWRPPGVAIEVLTTGDREIEFRPVSGYYQPARELVSVVSGGAPVIVEREYLETEGAGSTGAMLVVLKPDALTSSSLTVAERAQWRLAGESDTQWRDSGTTAVALRPGAYLVECKPLTGRTTPSPLNVTVVETQTTVAAATYTLADPQTGTAPTVLTFDTVSQSSALPYGYVGQLRSEVSNGSGFVVKPRVVATAAHMVFDDGTLSPVKGLQWIFQRDRLGYEPKPLIPRGFYMSTSYSAQRTAENTPGTSSPVSQDLDAAALYFLEDAGRGGFSGYLGSDSLINEWVTSPAPKTLVGYPTAGVSSSNEGRMHATAIANTSFTKSFGRTYTTPDVRSSGGGSGGPVCVQYQDGKYYPAAIYLGGSGQTVVRVIDSEVIEMFRRAEASGNGGENQGDGGITHSNSPLASSSSAGASLLVNIGPSAASGNGRWKIGANGSLKTDAYRYDGLMTNTVNVYFAALPGFLSPGDPPGSAVPITLTPGQLTTINASYHGIVTHPANRNANAQANATFTVGVTPSFPNVTADPQPTYRWRQNGVALSNGVRNGTTIAGATSATLVLSNVSADDQGNYTVVVTWNNGTQTSSSGALSVQKLAQSLTFAPPTIHVLGDPAISLNASSTSNLPVAYEVVSGPATIVGNSLSPTNFGSITIRAVQAGDTYFQPAAPVDRVITVTGQTMAQWQQKSFTANELLNPAISGPLADLDGDGINHMMEFALNLNPQVADRVTMVPGTGVCGLPLMRLETISGQLRLTSEFVRRRSAGSPGITYSMEFTDDIRNSNGWSESGTEVVTPIDATWERVKIIDSQAAGASRYGRLRIRQP